MELDAFILIGGRSSRLGDDKAFVEIGGKTLAARSAQMIETALSPVRITFVAGSEGQFKTDLLSSLGHPVITDLKPGLGAWSGIDVALVNARSKWIFIFASDLPFVSIELLQLLAGFADGGNDAVVPRQPDGRLQPLCAFYRVSSALAAVEEILAVGGRLPPLTAIFNRLKTRVIGSDEYSGLENADKLFLNINTAADLAAAIRNSPQRHRGHREFK